MVISRETAWQRLPYGGSSYSVEQVQTCHSSYNRAALLQSGCRRRAARAEPCCVTGVTTVCVAVSTSVLSEHLAVIVFA